MDVDFDYEVTKKLRRYATLVSEALGQPGESWCVESERPGAFYLAVDGRLAGFPDEDLALIWREKRGWYAVLERSDDSQLEEIAHLADSVKTSPAAVAEWVADLLRDDVRHLAKTA